MKAEIKKWGNSAALRLPSNVLAQAHLKVSSEVDIRVEGGSIIVRPVPKKSNKVRWPYSEEQLLEGLDTETAHADEVASITRREWGE
ncbi:AbrB/MazE/SpoVT family DNA-binding domain-containing protein [Pistricoccus aurantiacus]|uniref:AbrB/MazE/SpoVT family DNA-binding domain-containing protein n=1 Tax=Pistricoccus aurantiacus TaxID=1883414 RepID=UPI0036294AC8